MSIKLSNMVYTKHKQLVGCGFVPQLFLLQAMLYEHNYHKKNLCFLGLKKRNMFLEYSKLPWAAWNESLFNKGRIEASAQLMRQLNLPVRMGLKFSVSGSRECPGSWCPVGFPYYSHHYIASGLTSLSYYCESSDDSSRLTWQPHSLKYQAPRSCSVFHLKDTWFHTTRIFHFSELYAVLDMPPYSSGSLRTLSGNIHCRGFWS